MRNDIDYELHVTAHLKVADPGLLYLPGETEKNHGQLRHYGW
jgi:hypothetical protein